MAEESRARLGRGLAALIGDQAEPAQTTASEQGQKSVPIEFLTPNPENPRRTFDDGSLDELAASIKEKGIIQPILVRAVSDESNTFQIIAGERRWRAAQRAGLHKVPVVVVEASQRDALEMAIIENVQREDLDPLEEAAGYEQLAGQFGYTQADLARIIGKSRSHIANTIRLLKLPDFTKRLLSEGALSAGHGRALLGADDPDSLAKRAVDEGLTVRDLERLTQTPAAGARAAKSGERKDANKDTDTLALEKALAETLGLTVVIKHRGAGGGDVVIKYKTLEQLDSLCRRLRS